MDPDQIKRKKLLLIKLIKLTIYIQFKVGSGTAKIEDVDLDPIG